MRKVGARKDRDSTAIHHGKDKYNKTPLYKLQFFRLKEHEIKLSPFLIVSSYLPVNEGIHF